MTPEPAPPARATVTIILTPPPAPEQAQEAVEALRRGVDALWAARHAADCSPHALRNHAQYLSSCARLLLNEAMRQEQAEQKARREARREARRDAYGAD